MNTEPRMKLTTMIVIEPGDLDPIHTYRDLERLLDARLRDARQTLEWQLHRCMSLTFNIPTVPPSSSGD